MRRTRKDRRTVATSDMSEPTRRDFLFIATGAVGAVGTAAAVWPFVDQMNPDAGVQALASIEVNLGAIAEGSAITVLWRGKPVFIRHRTQKEIEEARAVPVDELPDQNAENANLPAGSPATDENRAEKPEWLIMVGVCTHLGCLYKWEQANNRFECPCHGSKFTREGFYIEGPAPRSLDTFVISIEGGEVAVDTGKKELGAPSADSPARAVPA